MFWKRNGKWLSYISNSWKKKNNEINGRNILSTLSVATQCLSQQLSSIKKLKRLNIIDKNINYGKTLSSELNKIISSTKLKNNLEISKVYWWPRIILKNITIDEDLVVSLLRQEFIEQGLFLGSTFNICYAHTKNDILKVTIDSFKKAVDNLAVILLSKFPKIFLKGNLIERTFKVR